MGSCVQQEELSWNIKVSIYQTHTGWSSCLMQALIKAVSRNDFDDTKEICNVAARQPLPTAVLYVNHQLSQEATPILFKHNRFNFNMSAKHIYDFLVDECPETKCFIRDISFGPRSVAGYDVFCTLCWGRLSGSTLSQHSDNSRSLGPLSRLLESMHLERLTFMLPHDSDCEVEGGRRRKRTQLTLEDPWWPAVDVSLAILLRGKIQMLRLEYPETYTKGKVEDGIEFNPCERFAAIRRLRGKCQNFSTWNFAVNWTSNVDEDGGTVLELTKIVSEQVAESA